MLKARTLFVVATVAVLGCDSPQDKAKEAEAARHTADQKVAEVTQNTERKEAEVQQRAAEEVARLEREGAKKVGEAEDRANQKADKATEALWQARDKARLDSSKKLDGLDHEVAELRPRLEKKLPSATAAAVVQDLQAKEAAVRESIRDLDQANADNLESLKKSISARLDVFEHALSDARKRV